MSNGTKRKLTSKCREYFRVKEIKRIKKEWFEIYKSVTGIDVFECMECHIGRLVKCRIIKPDKAKVRN
jgi:hypothetical protein